MHQYEFSQNSYLHVYHIIAEQMNRYYFGILIRKIMVCTLSICEHALHFLSQVVTQMLQCNNPSIINMELILIQSLYLDNTAPLDSLEYNKF